ncbi:ribosomal 40S subunit protein S13 [Maublancomyces gigas]|uniref:Ribosomal 40S subunit protein S13 n=1 Tax=Discina gigas TaxID=1032678 RepID=A0ABR3GIG1_9PEZI
MGYLCVRNPVLSDSPQLVRCPPNPQESEIQREGTHINAGNRLKTTPEQVVEQICKLAKKGATPSQIGVVLRDSHGIAQVKVVTGTSSLSSSLPIWWW